MYVTLIIPTVVGIVCQDSVPPIPAFLYLHNSCVPQRLLVAQPVGDRLSVDAR